MRASSRTGALILRETLCLECRGKDQKSRRREFKRQCVDYKGGKCEACGYNMCLDAMSFHHEDPDKKDFEINSMRLRRNALERSKAELDKCRLLCVRCHVEEHARLNGTL